MKTPIKHIISIAVITILVFIAYSNTFDAEWHFDDKPNILNNYSVHASSFSDIVNARHMTGKMTRCLGFVSFAFNWYFHGKNVAGYHAANILIHITVTVLVYCTVFLTLTLPAFRKIPFKTVWLASLFSALLWGLSPVQTQAVTYIVQRLTSLSALFFMLSFMLYIKGRRCMIGGNMRAGIVLALCALPVYGAAVLTKENTIMLPFLVLAYEHLFISRIRSCRDRRLVIFVFFMAAGFVFISIARPGVFKIFINLSESYEKREFTPYERVLTQFRVMVRYLTLILFPHPGRLNLDYNYVISRDIVTPVTTLFSMIFIFISILFAFFARNRFQLISFCILWYFLNNIVESTVIALEIIFEHRMYIPSIGVILMITVLLFRLADRNTGRTAGETV